MNSRPPTGSIPDAPGSYQFLDKDGRVLYVGKAKSLRQRLASYFQDPAALPLRTSQMVAQADHVEWVVVGTEVEALMLEHSLIQAHQPRFNVRLKDDKTYPWLAVSVGEEWPRPMVFRGRKRKGVRYFGPYGHVGALRETLDLLLRSFPVRTCSDAKFRRHQRLGRPCLLFDIERCSGPCVGAVDHDRYAELVEDLMAFLSGDTAAVVKRLETEMAEAAEGLEFERAARLRDSLTAVRKAAETQQMVSERPEDLDVVGIVDDDLEAAVQVFHVRKGRVVGRSGSIADKVEDLTSPQLVSRVVEQLYGDPGAEVPRRVLVPCPPESADVLEAWLATLRGGPVTLAVPRRGDKKALQEMVVRNASEDLARHRLRRASDHNSRSRALTELQSALGLRQAPLRIECYDMSHLQGTDYVGSMVVFEDGLAKKADYRKFKVKTVAGNDDYAAMEEVLRRRLTALVEERAAGPVPGRRRFAYPPQLLLLDGGKGQLGVGERVVAELGLATEVELAALAKQFEEVYRPGAPDPVRIPRGTEALYLLQRVRDEAHRFAITYHRQRRGTRMTAGVLEGVVGMGPARRARLVKEMGGVRALRAASPEDLRALSWLPEAVADAVYEALHGTGRSPRAGIGPVAAGVRDWGVMNEFLVVAGMSGAGRSTAAATLEDLGWFVIDNLPPSLFTKVAELVGRPGSETERVALVIGRGGGENLEEVLPVLDSLEEARHRVRVLFLDAPDDVLVRRFEGTRRRHPVAGGGVEGSIADERRMLEVVRARADVLLDTGELNANQLRQRILELFAEAGGSGQMQTSIVSFGYKHGIPLDVDVVFDCRFLPNPYWLEALRPMSGLDPAVRQYVFAQAETAAFLDKVEDLLVMLVPAFVREGKSYLTVAMGCTGGRHRSVALAEALSERLAAHGVDTSVFHRDVER